MEKSRDVATEDFVGVDLEQAQEFARGDPFVRNGVVRNWEIREWDEAFLP